MMNRDPLGGADAASVGATGPPVECVPVTFVECIGDVCLHWSVVEVDARDVPGVHAPNCLIFSRQDCVRRVWEYPANWLDLDDTELVALSWHR
jgi:hypothetical protein